jgi:F-type H+-transporting ATPase subunit a
MNLTTRQKVLGGLGLYLLVGIIVAVVVGSSGQNEDFSPVAEFEVTPWIDLPGPLDFNRAVLYLLLVTIITVGVMVYVANRMAARPNRVQTAVESLYLLMKGNIVGDNMDEATARRWFPFVGTLFVFIWVSNLVGYIPLPTNDLHPFTVFGVEVPSFALYAATANISIPLVLTLMVWVGYHIDGIRVHGLIGYFRTLIPAGTPKPLRPALFVIELISDFVRLISLSVRLFANILAGHLLLLFMAGGLAVILGAAAIAWFTLPLAVAFFIFEIVLISTLQAFIFATLAAIYLGGATAESH